VDVDPRGPNPCQGGRLCNLPHPHRVPELAGTNLGLLHQRTLEHSLTKVLKFGDRVRKELCDVEEGGVLRDREELEAMNPARISGHRGGRAPLIVHPIEGPDGKDDVRVHAVVDLHLHLRKTNTREREERERSQRFVCFVWPNFCVVHFCARKKKEKEMK